MDIAEDVKGGIRELAIGYWVEATKAAKPGDIISSIDLIEKAIRDERERCAMVADDYIGTHDTAYIIASAIRSGER